MKCFNQKKKNCIKYSIKNAKYDIMIYMSRKNKPLLFLGDYTGFFLIRYLSFP